MTDQELDQLKDTLAHDDGLSPHHMADFQKLFDELRRRSEPDLRGQLLQAVLHWVRNDDNGSYLVGMELPDTEFRDADQKRAEAYVRGHLRQMEGLFIEAWNRWHEKALEAE